jgi:inorganic pyrophosphatase
LFADYEEMSIHFKNIYFKVCQIPFVDGQNDHHTTVVNFIRDYANDNNPAYDYGWTPLHTNAQDGDQLTVLLILQYAKHDYYMYGSLQRPFSLYRNII